MPDIKQTLQSLKAKGRVQQGPAQPRKLDRSGQPRRPDEHLKRSAQEVVEEAESQEPLVTAPVTSAEPSAPIKKPEKDKVAAKAQEVPTPPGPQTTIEPVTTIVSPLLEIVEAKPLAAPDSIIRKGAERAPLDATPTPIGAPALTLVEEPPRVDNAPTTQLTDSARELAAITRLLRADTCYYLAFLEMRDPLTGIVDLPHLAYAELFAVRKNTVAPMIKRLVDAGALTVERAYDAGTRTTWAYRVADRKKLAERAPAPGAL